MTLSEIKRQKYDLVVGLGSNCQTAYHMVKHNLRSFASPIDWMVFGYIYNLNRAVRNEFHDFMRIRNLEMKKPNGEHYIIYDHIYDCYSVHDFDITEDQNRWYESYDDFREKLDRRINNFYANVKNASSILFVRTGVEYKGIIELMNILKERTKASVNILGINYGDSLREIDCEDDNVCLVEIRNTQERWEGIDQDWDYLLSEIKLSGEPLAVRPGKVDTEIFSKAIS